MWLKKLVNTGVGVLESAEEWVEPPAVDSIWLGQISGPGNKMRQYEAPAALQVQLDGHVCRMNHNGLVSQQVYTAYIVLNIVSTVIIITSLTILSNSSIINSSSWNQSAA